MKNIKLILCGIFALAAFAACEDDGYADYDAGSTQTEALNGEFYIDIMDADGSIIVPNALHKLYDRNDTLYITDRNGPDPTDFSGWFTETRLNYDANNLTFSITDSENTADGTMITITEGKILKGAGHSASGSPTDSIYFKAVYDYEPERVLTFAGHRRTGFEEDEL